MREIKFRAWDIESNEFNFIDLREAVANDDAYSLCGNQGTAWEKDRENSCAFYCKCNIQQFTGLKDKKGKEIYEGDIVKVIGHYQDETDMYSFWDEYIGVITWIDGSWVIESICEGSCEYLTQDSLYNSESIRKVEVIGNIYENEELIKYDNNKNN